MSVGRRERQKEKIINVGIKGLAKHEVIEFLLYPFIPRKDVMPIARALLEAYGDLNAIFDASYEELCKIEGMTKSSALYFSTIKEIVKNSRQEILEEKLDFSCFASTQEYLMEKLDFSNKEKMVMILTDIHGKLVKIESFCNNEIDGTTISTRKIAEKALSSRAKRAIFAHNHPAGMLFPSEDDVRSTKQIAMVLGGLGVEVTDHIIISGDKTYSMWMNGDLNDVRGEEAVRAFRELNKGKPISEVKYY